MRIQYALWCHSYALALLVYSVEEGRPSRDGSILRGDSEMWGESPHDPEEAIMEEFKRLEVNYTELLSEIDDYLARGEMWPDQKLPRNIGRALKLLNLRQIITEVESSAASCKACRLVVGLLQHFIRAGKTKEYIVQISYKFCVILKILTQRVCKGIAELFVGEIVTVLKRVLLGPKEICSFFIGEACGDVFIAPSLDWEVVFPPFPKPTPKAFPVPKGGAATLKVLHLSDTHFDPHYQEGSNADCKEPLCCRLTSGPPPNPAAAAGRWGDYRKCDIPRRTIYNMFTHITATHPDIDYIIWTGDLPPHDVWNTTREENLRVLKETVKQMITMFPGIQIFPAIGNHESSPSNSFPPPFIQDEYAINWLYNELDTQWRKWLPSSVSKTVRSGAFYSVLVRPGFRIISLNMNYCYKLNWWLLINSTDPANELQWFINELQNAEFNREKVHVIGHIPPGCSDCVKVWSRNYYNIINRYENTIMAQFFGHTHFDEFEVFYDKQDMGRAISIAYVAPSVTPYDDLNPGYRIYYVDGDHDQSTRAVVDHETWVMNLREANLYDYPIWYKEYSTRRAYQMPSLIPQEWDNYIYRLAENDIIFEIYYKHYWKSSPVKPPCDRKCKKRMLCDLRSGRSHVRKSLCLDLESRIDAQTETGWRAWINNIIASSRRFAREVWDTVVSALITWWRSGRVMGLVRQVWNTLVCPLITWWTSGKVMGCLS